MFSGTFRKAFVNSLTQNLNDKTLFASKHFRYIPLLPKGVFIAVSNYVFLFVFLCYAYSG